MLLTPTSLLGCSPSCRLWLPGVYPDPFSHTNGSLRSSVAVLVAYKLQVVFCYILNEICPLRTSCPQLFHLCESFCLQYMLSRLWLSFVSADVEDDEHNFYMWFSLHLNSTCRMYWMLRLCVCCVSHALSRGPRHALRA